MKKDSWIKIGIYLSAIYFVPLAACLLFISTSGYDYFVIGYTLLCVPLIAYFYVRSPIEIGNFHLKAIVGAVFTGALVLFMFRYLVLVGEVIGVNV